MRKVGSFQPSGLIALDWLVLIDLSQTTTIIIATMALPNSCLFVTINFYKCPTKLIYKLKVHMAFQFHNMRM